MVNKTETNSHSHPKIGRLGFGTCQPEKNGLTLFSIQSDPSALPGPGEDLRLIFNLLFGEREVSETHPDYSLVPQAKIWRGPI